MVTTVLFHTSAYLFFFALGYKFGRRVEKYENNQKQ